MDVQLNELIEKIKNDGIRSAEDEASRIIVDAQKQAADIVSKAEIEARRIQKVAGVEAEKTERSGTEALRHAGRDLLLTVRSSIEDMFNRIVKSSVTDSLNPELLSQAVMETIRSLAIESLSGVEVQIPENQFALIEPGLRGAMVDEFKKGMKIAPVKGLDAGFRVSIKNGSMFYDFSDQEIVEMLSRFLNPQLVKIISDQE